MMSPPGECFGAVGKEDSRKREEGVMPKRAMVAFLLLAFGLFMLGLETLHANLVRPRHAARLERMEALVRALGLTDLALFTEARYVRHLSQADLFTPFQDAPASFEHFPSGTLVSPPAHLARLEGRLRYTEFGKGKP